MSEGEPVNPTMSAERMTPTVKDANADLGSGTSGENLSAPEKLSTLDWAQENMHNISFVSTEKIGDGGNFEFTIKDQKFKDVDEIILQGKVEQTGQRDVAVYDPEKTQEYPDFNKQEYLDKKIVVVSKVTGRGANRERKNIAFAVPADEAEKIEPRKNLPNESFNDVLQAVNEFEKKIETQSFEEMLANRENTPLTSRIVLANKEVQQMLVDKDLDPKVATKYLSGYLKTRLKDKNLRDLDQYKSFKGEINEYLDKFFNVPKPEPVAVADKKSDIADVQEADTEPTIATPQIVPMPREEIEARKEIREKPVYEKIIQSPKVHEFAEKQGGYSNRSFGTAVEDYLMKYPEIKRTPEVYWEGLFEFLSKKIETWEGMQKAA